MQVMISVVNPGKAKQIDAIPQMVDKWENRLLTLDRDFKEKVSSRMRSAILISMLPNEIQDTFIQNAEKYEDYGPTKEKIMAIVEAKKSLRSPDEIPA